MKAVQLRANGRWGSDDGNPGLAFIGVPVDAEDGDTAVVWVANCDCTIYRKCPLARALTYAAENLGYGAVSVSRKRQTRGRKLDRVRRAPRRRR